MACVAPVRACVAQWNYMAARATLPKTAPRTIWLSVRGVSASGSWGNFVAKNHLLAPPVGC